MARIYKTYQGCRNNPNKCTGLDLSGKGRKSIPNTNVLKEFSFIQTLDLSDNKISKVPKRVKELTELEDLNLSQNMIKKIDPAISNLSMLRTLNLNDNFIEKLPQSIMDLQGLQTLQIWGQTYDLREEKPPKSFKDVPEKPLQEIPHLEGFEEHGIYHDVQRCINAPNFCHHLILDPMKIPKKAPQKKRNRFLTIKQLQGLSGIQTLDLSNNNLSVVNENVRYLTGLQHLFIGNNQIHTINKNIGKLSNLEIVHADSNQLTEVPEEMGNLRNLKEVYLSNNPIQSVPTVLKKMDINLNLKGTPYFEAMTKRLQQEYQEESAIGEFMFNIFGEQWENDN